MTNNKSKGLPAIPFPFATAIVACASICFLPSYDGDFVFDDSEAIVNNNDVKTTEITDLFKNDFWGMKLSHNQSHKSYRPITILTFRLQYWLRNGTLFSRDFHLVNIILHSIVCLLSLSVFALFLDQKSRKLAFYSAALFAVHPIHAEAVAGIVGRADILSTLFTWLGILCYSRFPLTKKLFLKWSSISVSLLSVAVAMLCKETGITAIGILAVYDVTIINKIVPTDFIKFLTLKYSLAETKHFIASKKGLMTRLLLLITVSILLLSLRFSVMGFTAPTFQLVDNPASFQDNCVIRFLNYNYIHSLNLWLLLCPEWLCFDWSMGCTAVMEDVKNVRIFAVSLYWLFLAALVSSVFSKRDVRRVRNVTMGLALLIIPFLPASNFFFRVGFVIAERTLYASSAGFCLLVGLGLEALCARFASRTPLLFYAGLLALFFSRSWMRSNEWRTETTLFRSGINVCPLNAKVHYNIGKNAADIGDSSLAELEYEEALRLNPTYAQAMNNLGNLMKAKGNLTKAEKLFREAIKLKEDFAAAWMNLGITLSAMNKYNDSENSYMRALMYRSNYPDCFYNLSLLYLEQKLYQKALKALETAIQQKRSHRRAWINLMLVLSDLGEFSKALEMGKTALIFLPDDSGIHFNIANILGRFERFEEAEKYFQTAIYYEPDNALYYTNLGVLYHRWNKLQEAEAMYKGALKINPELPSAQKNLRRLKLAAKQ